MTLAGRDRPAAAGASFVFFAQGVDDLNDPDKRFILTAPDIELLNPNTRTCPVFRSGRDADLTKSIYRRVPVLVRDGDPDGNPWAVELARMFHMSDDSPLFSTSDPSVAQSATHDDNVSAPGEHRWLRLYEAKMFHNLDHRWATYVAGGTRDLTHSEKRDPGLVSNPRYWFPESEIASHTPVPWTEEWLLSVRKIARSTDERTLIAAAIPRAGVEIPRIAFTSRTRKRHLFSYRS